MSIVARRVRATPERTGLETWAVIVDLVSQPTSTARADLVAVNGVAGCLIADHAPEQSPIVLAGCGPRLRIYCVYGDDAVTGEGGNEERLSWDPTDGDWIMSLPASREDIAWVRVELAKRTKRVVAYCFEDEEAGKTARRADAVDVKINTEAFKRL
jgi:hypothetical protein